MIFKKLRKIRNQKLENNQTDSEDVKVLESFLEIPISSAEGVFAIFRKLPNAIEMHGEGKQGYLYVPGARKDRCLLVAHADTYFDFEYQNEQLENKIFFEDEAYHGTSTVASIGADDRSGCAILWLMRNSGHSLLILDGEEHGQVGAHFLRDRSPQLFQELNDHSFILQLDRRGSNDYRYYNIPVTAEFEKYIKEETGYHLAVGSGRTDIVALCNRVCGVNLSVGYYNEHRPEEYLVVSEWKHTLSIVRRMLKKPLKRYSF